MLGFRSNEQTIIWRYYRAIEWNFQKKLRFAGIIKFDDFASKASKTLLVTFTAIKMTSQHWKRFEYRAGIPTAISGLSFEKSRWLKNRQLPVFWARNSKSHCADHTTQANILFETFFPYDTRKVFRVSGLYDHIWVVELMLYNCARSCLLVWKDYF